MRVAKEAGGDFLLLSVQDMLLPDATEEKFLAALEALDAPLSVPACNSFIRRQDLLCVGPKANHDEVLEHVAVTFARAQRAGVKMVVFGSSGTRRIPEGWDKARATDQLVAVLKRMAPMAAGHGVSIALEPLNQRECNFINRIGEVRGIVDAVGHAAVVGVADLYHMILEGDQPHDLREALPVVGHVELALPDGRRLPGADDKTFVPWFRVLREVGYKGTIAMEGSWRDEDVAPAFASLRRQWAEAGRSE